MKIKLIITSIAVCVSLHANVPAFGPPAIDTRAPAYFATLVGQADYVVIPIYDSKSQSMRDPVVVRDRARLDSLEKILGQAVYQPTSHILAVVAGGPITFYSKEKSRILTLESFGKIIRLNGKDFKVDTKTSAGIDEWLKQ